MRSTLLSSRDLSSSMPLQFLISMLDYMVMPLINSFPLMAKEDRIRIRIRIQIQNPS